mmetsp:Transcript_130727/g.419287  ORF Transcript_130727/g.419287 Transcript_130727/m.419287 type:complete len:274 (-) Transcript_130727:1506-2327(-)
MHAELHIQHNRPNGARGNEPLEERLSEALPAGALVEDRGGQLLVVAEQHHALGAQAQGHQGRRQHALRALVDDDAGELELFVVLVAGARARRHGNTKSLHRLTLELHPRVALRVLPSLGGDVVRVALQAHHVRHALVVCGGAQPDALDVLLKQGLDEAVCGRIAVRTAQDVVVLEDDLPCLHDPDCCRSLSSAGRALHQGDARVHGGVDNAPLRHRQTGIFRAAALGALQLLPRHALASHAGLRVAPQHRTPRQIRQVHLPQVAAERGHVAGR